MTNILLVGLGDLGSLIATEALQQGMTVQAMRRQAKSLSGVKLIRHDATTSWPDISDNITDLVLCVAPDSRADAAYRQAYLVIASHAIEWLRQQPVPPHVWLVSSTSVYGQQHGEWVDEDSPRLPERNTAKILVATEDLWLKSGMPCTMLRPAGLYGPGRDMMLRIAQTAQHIVEKQPVYTNRIEISDCARAIIHLLLRRQRGFVVENAYNLADLEPAPYREVIQFLQQQLKIATDQPQFLQRGSKRVSVQRLQQTGFCWQYPDYRAGYLSIL